MNQLEKKVLTELYNQNNEDKYKVVSISEINSFETNNNLLNIINQLSDRGCINLKFLDNENICYTISAKDRLFIAEEIEKYKVLKDLQLKEQQKKEKEKVLQKKEKNKIKNSKKVAVEILDDDNNIQNKKTAKNILPKNKNDVIIEVDKKRIFNLLGIEVVRFCLSMLATFVAMIIFFLIFVW